MALIPTKKIPQLTAYGAPLGGTELLEIWSVNTSRRITARDFILPIDSVLTLTPLGVVGSNARQMTSGIGIAFVDGGPGSTLSINATGAVAGPANPTALVGLTAVNGAALTYMRSDAAPPLSQAIAPTWTGPHVYTSIGGDFGSSIEIRTASPFLLLNENDAAADNRKWAVFALSETFIAAAFPEVGAGTIWLQVDRTGTTIDAIQLLATTVSVNGQNVRDAAILTSGTVATARLGSGVADATTWLRGDQSWQLLPGNFTGFANPTASIGLAIVNGVATTAMRSDAAPALSQAIAPTWTAQHIFSLSGATNAAILVSSAQPQTDYNETDGAANNRRWRWEAQGEQFLGRTVNDANSAAVTWIAVDRTLNVVDAIALTSTALTWNGSPISTAVGANPTASLGLTAINGVAATFMRSDGAPALSQSIAPSWTGQHIFARASSNLFTDVALSVASTLPVILFNETDAAVNNRGWSFRAQGEDFTFAVSSDDGLTNTNIFNISRTGTVVDAIAFPTATVNSFVIGPTPASLTNRMTAITSGVTGTLGVTQTGVAGNDGIAVHHQATTGDNSFMQFGTEASFTTRGSISYNRAGGLTAYNTTSDSRRKKNIRNAPESSSIIDAIKIRSFEWIDSDVSLSHWLIAQELHAICPYAVSQGDETHDWAIDTSKLVPLLVKEIQSMRGRLAVLETPGNSNRVN